METECHCIALGGTELAIDQAGLQLQLPCLPSAGFKGVHHHTRPSALFFTKCIDLLIWCGRVGGYSGATACYGSQRTACGTGFSLPPTWILGIELGSMGLTPNAVTESFCWPPLLLAISPSLSVSLFSKRFPLPCFLFPSLPEAFTSPQEVFLAFAKSPLG